MSVYVMGQLNFRSIDHYRRYQAQFPAVFSASNGKALCADESPKTLEGDIRVDKIVLLTRPNYSSVAELALRHRCEVVVLDSPGMGDSIAAAVSAQPDYRGWLISLGDMPFIQVDTLERVAQSLTADAISVPVFEGQYGHPVGFGRAFGPALMGLAGEKGARRLFKGAKVNEIVVDDPGVLWDVDVPSALLFK